MELKNRPIGFFDSGVGGISVLKEAVKIMPEENYIYYGDSKNAPYGEKSIEEVRALTEKAVEFLVEKGCKAIVIACNTATSASIKDIRSKYRSIPIIGIEPAIKPAIEQNKRGKILIMATPITLREKKFRLLLEKYNKRNTIELLPCAGLADLIEEGKIDHFETVEYLEKKLLPLKCEKIEHVVLGCTHYPFIEEHIKDILGKNVTIIHGGEGTVRQLKRKLEDRKLKKIEESIGEIKVINSKNNELKELCYKLLKD